MLAFVWRVFGGDRRGRTKISMGVISVFQENYESGLGHSWNIVSELI